jgi:ribosome assembly protein YihI (activator of Der GTPase)
MKRTIKITESQLKKIIDRLSEGEYHVDEEVSPEEVKMMKQDLTDISDLTKELGLTSETDDLLDEDIFLEEEKIDPSKGIAGLPMA